MKLGTKMRTIPIVKSPFNDYDAGGFRTNRMGCKSSKTADESILYNLRYRWPEELKELTDRQLIDEYDEFAMSDLFGNNDERFLEWCGL